MKKIILFILLTVSTNVMSEWTRVTDSKDDDFSVYVDYGSIKRKGHKVKMWVLFDSKTTQQYENYRYLSSVTHVEYDCEEETSRSLDDHGYSENMKNGVIVYSFPNHKGEPSSIRPNTIESLNYKIACGKK